MLPRLWFSPFFPVWLPHRRPCTVLFLPVPARLPHCRALSVLGCASLLSLSWLRCCFGELSALFPLPPSAHVGWPALGRVCPASLRPFAALVFFSFLAFCAAFSPPWGSSLGCLCPRPSLPCAFPAALAFRRHLRMLLSRAYVLLVGGGFNLVRLFFAGLGAGFFSLGCGLWSLWVLGPLFLLRSFWPRSLLSPLSLHAFSLPSRFSGFALCLSFSRCFLSAVLFVHHGFFTGLSSLLFFPSLLISSFCMVYSSFLVSSVSSFSCFPTLLSLRIEFARLPVFFSPPPSLYRSAGCSCLLSAPFGHCWVLHLLLGSFFSVLLVPRSRCAGSLR